MTKQVSNKKNWNGAHLAIENQYTHQTYFGHVIDDNGTELKVNIGDNRIYTFTRNTVWNFRHTRYFGE